MFGWWKQRQRAKEREIFRFWDGQRNRFADPIVLMRALSNHPELRLDSHPQLAAQGDQDSLEIVLRATQEVMKVGKLDERTGTGLTEMETLELLLSFADFIGDLKKNGSLLPTSPVITDQQAFQTETVMNASLASG